jgi:hypothetical protein
MGHVPEKLVIELRDRFGITTAIETGTYKGQSTRFLAQCFKRVWSIEMDKSWWVRACEVLSDSDNLTLVHGDSRDELEAILSKINEPCILWLDAHWCGGARDDQKPEEECPLSEELRSIVAHNKEHVILIDDARLFTGRPTYPHNPALWPTYEDIKQLLPNGYTTSVHDDIIVSVPDAMHYVVKDWKHGKLS